MHAVMNKDKPPERRLRRYKPSLNSVATALTQEIWLKQKVKDDP